MVAVKDFLELVTWGCQTLVVLGAAFDGTWFPPIGTFRKAVPGYMVQEQTIRRPERKAVRWRLAECPKTLERAGKAYPCQTQPRPPRCVRHHRPYQVVGHQPHPQLLAASLGALAVELLQPHRRLDVAKPQLHLPAPPIQCHQHPLRIELRLQKRRGQRHLAGPQTRTLHPELHHPHPELLREPVGLNPLTRFLRTLPFDDPVVIPELEHPTRPGLALAQPHQAVHAPLPYSR